MSIKQMPYELKRSGKGYFVETKGTHKRHSKRPLPLSRAKAQMRALYASMNGYKRKSKAFDYSKRKTSRRVRRKIGLVTGRE